MYPPFPPEVLRIGPFTVQWYGLLIVIGAVLAAFVASREAFRRGEDPERAWDVLVWCLVFGIIGARLYHVFSRPAGGFAGWDYYRQYPLDIIAFWKGGFRGLGIYGGVIGGVLGLFLYTRRHRLSFRRWLDIVTPGLLLAQAIGRWGNFINQELYGPPMQHPMPWGLKIDAQHRFGEYMDLQRYPVETTRFHPTFLYESLWNLAGFALLLWASRRFAPRLRDGDLFFLYMVWYPFGRFWIEMLRPDAWTIGGMAAAQWIALASILAATAALSLNHQLISRLGRSR
ncbi:MAG: prolipoprotein diacylglyceryl transferase [Anaerolineae bacterium]|nr:prolipoprotein diacylglyceryl transferase [Anaerolineae bacterium]MDW8099553.1 prolipoprotein diacylglyceryl transferase [Anaerolineae bacterium]